MANLFAYFDGALPQLFTEMKVCWKTFLKGGTKKITRNLEKGLDMAHIQITL